MVTMDDALKVLVLDPDPASRKALRQALAAAGLNAIEADPEADLRLVVETSRPDKVVLEAGRLADLLERLDAVTEGAVAGIFVHVAGHLVYANPRMAEMLGYSIEELRNLYGSPVLDFVHPDDRALVADRMRRRMAGETPPLAYSFKMLHKDGRPVPVELLVTTIRWAGRDAVLGHVVDLTERERARLELAEALDQARRRADENEALFESIKEVLESGDFDATIRRVFDRCRTQVGAGAGYVALLGPNGEHEEVIYTELGDRQCRVEMDGPVPIRGLRAEVYRTGGARIVNSFSGSAWEDALPKGYPVLDNVLFIPLRAGDRNLGILGLANKPGGFSDEDAHLAAHFGSVAALALHNRRMNEEKRRTQAQLLQAQKMEAVGVLAGGIAHDFNNILTEITSNVSLALLDAHPDEPLREVLEEVAASAQRAADLTQKLLAYGRKQVFEKRPILLNDVVRDMERMLRRLIGEDVDLVLDLAGDLGVVLADPGQVEQCVMNLCVNARQAMPEGGRLTIETRNVRLDEAYATTHAYTKTGDYVVLAVTDTGVGMDEDVRSRAFDPFFTTRESQGGTGLGLAVVYGIVKQHGGSVEVYSEVGKGATFKLYFPRVQERAGPVRAGKKETGSVERGTETVLYVEDQPRLRAATARILERLGYTVLQASDGKTALEAAKGTAGTLHLLVTDLVMPKMSGKELADRLKKSHPLLRVLFTSGYPAGAAVGNGLIEAGERFLPKPYTAEALARAIREVLDEPAEGGRE